MRPEPKFVPGELVVIAHSLKFPEMVGSQTEIVGLKWVDEWTDGSPPGWGYKTKEVVHMERASWAEFQLRKLPPDTPSTFDASIWRPKREVA